MKKRFYSSLATLCIVAVTDSMLLSSCSNDEDINETNHLLSVEKHTPEEIEFIQNWENMEDVEVLTSRGKTRINTPWNLKARISTIPISIANDVKKKDGWEVVFNALGDSGLDGANYFGLYNNRLGIFRIFAYLEKPIGAGNECSFDISVGPQQYPMNMHTMYNALPYAVPTSLENLNLSMDFFGKEMGNSFRVYSSPYNITSETAESAGWTCFDVDMSGYNPNPSVLWPTTQYGQMISIIGTNREKTDITLTGTVTSKTSGKIVEQIPVKTVNSGGGIGSVFNTLGNAAQGDVGKYICGFIGDIFGVKSLVETAKTLGTVLQVAGSIADEAHKKVKEGESDPTARPLIMDGMTGKLELSTTGEMNLTGYLSKAAVSSFKPIQFGNAYVHTDNPNSHFGQGVWGLEDAPVIYVADDVMVGERERVNLFRRKGSKQYANKEVESYGLRMVQFLDPTSIRVNINTKVFPGLDSVKVSCYYGVYPSEQKGHTSQYAKLMKLNRPDVTIFKNDQTIRYDSRNPNGNIQYVQLPAGQLYISDMGETQNNYTAGIQQAGSNYKYCGLLNRTFEKPFIVDPQVYFPITTSSTQTSLYDAECPDFVAVVTISFHYDGRYYYFTERYLPQIKKISRKDLAGKLNQLNKYASDCKNNVAINMLNTNASCGVYHPGGSQFVERAIKILNCIK